MLDLFYPRAVVPKNVRVVRRAMDVEPAKRAQVEALTPAEAEKRRKRNEASREWWLANKEKVARNRAKKAESL